MAMVYILLCGAYLQSSRLTAYRRNGRLVPFSVSQA